MSLSQDRPTNPAKRFMTIKSGAVIYYDKEQGENIKVPTPLEFIVLDQLATVKGWSDQDNSGYWSNEVRSVGRDVLTVRTKNGIKEQGIWRDIKASPSIAGAKYHASIYVATKGRDGLEISNLALTGAALNAWIEFTRTNRVNSVAVILSGWKDDKKGSVSFKVPVFEASPMENKDEAIELDKQLQAYFSEYFSTPAEGSHDEVVEAQVELIDESEENTPIDLDSIPF